MPAYTIHVSCHCKTFKQFFELPESAFPLKSSVCHCNKCRHVSGHLFGTFAVIPLPMSQTPPTVGLIGYKSSVNMTRWFCGTCGATCWQNDRTAGANKESLWEWEIPVGLVDKVEVDGKERKGKIAGLLNRVQMYVDDVSDGGAAIWINRCKLDGMDRRTQGRTSQVVEDSDLAAIIMSSRQKAVEALQSSENDRVLMACDCEGVQLWLQPPGPEGKLYSAGLDACESCRKVSGPDVLAWMTVPKSKVTLKGSDQLDAHASCFLVYSTSKGVSRGFCKECGAHVYWLIEGRDTIDLGIGLLRSEIGGRAENWFVWDKYGDDFVGYVEDAVDEDFVNNLAIGIKNDTWTM